MEHLKPIVAIGLAFIALVALPARADLADQLARQVTIHRDEWGVPHITGQTDNSVVFGVAYAQCEDHFWQVEETMLQVLGRYAEVTGESGEGRIKGMLPPHVRVAHKTGTLDESATNDVGVMVLPEEAGHVAMAVFVKNSEGPVENRERIIAQTARAAYDYFMFANR